MVCLSAPTAGSAAQNERLGQRPQVVHSFRELLERDIDRSGYVSAGEFCTGTYVYDCAFAFLYELFVLH
jgi:hypothetical protein